MLNYDKHLQKKRTPKAKVAVFTGEEAGALAACNCSGVMTPKVFALRLPIILFVFVQVRTLSK